MFSSLPYCTRFVLLLILILVSTCLSALRISARITDTEGKPLEDVLISDGRMAVFSYPDGSFNFEAQTDSLSFSRLGFERKILNLNAIHSTVILEAKPIILSTVRVTEHYEPGFGSALDKTILSPDSATPASGAAELLMQESAIHTSGTHLLGEDQTLSLLGNLDRHTLIILDGVPLNPHGRAVDLANLPLDSIKRIEIVKGNASLYGGASAIGGIVYLYTDDVSTAHPVKLEQESAYGSFNQLQNRLAYDQLSPVFSFKVALNRLSSDNDFTYKPRPWWNLSGKLTRHNNRKEQQSTTLEMSSALGKANLRYWLDAEQFYRQLPGPVNFLDIYKNAYLTGQSLHHNSTLGWQAKRFSEDLIFWQHDDGTEYNNNNAENPVYPTHYRQEHTALGVKHHAEYSYAFLKPALEWELSRQSYELNDLLYPSLSIKNTSRIQKSLAFQTRAENDFSVYTNQFQAGLRWDKVTDFESFYSWRLEEVLTRDGLIQIKAGGYFGSSFSLPSFYDLYWKGDAQSLGNPDLEPETSLGWNAWTQISYASYSFKAAYYSSEVKKLIQWRQTYLYGTVWKPVNIGKASIRNWEFSAKANPLAWFKLESSLTLTSAKDEDLHANLTYTPEAKWNTGITLSRSGFSLVLEHNYTGRQWSTPDNLIDPIPSLKLFNASLGYSRTFGKFNGQLSFSLNNLFDRQYEIYAYVPQPGFNWMSSLALKYEM
jgi:outer membrane cobalamin receptor